MNISVRTPKKQPTVSADAHATKGALQHEDHVRVVRRLRAAVWQDPAALGSASGATLPELHPAYLEMERQVTLDDFDDPQASLEKFESLIAYFNARVRTQTASACSSSHIDAVALFRCVGTEPAHESAPPLPLILQKCRVALGSYAQQVHAVLRRVRASRVVRAEFPFTAPPNAPAPVDVNVSPRAGSSSPMPSDDTTLSLLLDFLVDRGGLSVPEALLVVTACDTRALEGLGFIGSALPHLHPVTVAYKCCVETPMDPRIAKALLERKVTDALADTTQLGGNEAPHAPLGLHGACLTWLKTAAAAAGPATELDPVEASDIASMLPVSLGMAAAHPRATPSLPSLSLLQCAQTVAAATSRDVGPGPDTVEALRHALSRFALNKNQFRQFVVGIGVRMPAAESDLLFDIWTAVPASSPVTVVTLDDLVGRLSLPLSSRFAQQVSAAEHHRLRCALRSLVVQGTLDAAAAFSSGTAPVGFPFAEFSERLLLAWAAVPAVDGADPTTVVLQRLFQAARLALGGLKQVCASAEVDGLLEHVVRDFMVLAAQAAFVPSTATSLPLAFVAFLRAPVSQVLDDTSTARFGPLLGVSAPRTAAIEKAWARLVGAAALETAHAADAGADAAVLHDTFMPLAGVGAGAAAFDLTVVPADALASTVGGAKLGMWVRTAQSESPPNHAGTLSHGAGRVAAETALRPAAASFALRRCLALAAWLSQVMGGAGATPKIAACSLFLFGVPSVLLADDGSGDEHSGDHGALNPQHHWLAPISFTSRVALAGTRISFTTFASFWASVGDAFTDDSGLQQLLWHGYALHRDGGPEQLLQFQRQRWQKVETCISGPRGCGAVGAAFLADAREVAAALEGLDPEAAEMDFATEPGNGIESGPTSPSRISFAGQLARDDSASLGATAVASVGGTAPASPLAPASPSAVAYDRRHASGSDVATVAPTQPGHQRRGLTSRQNVEVTPKIGSSASAALHLDASALSHQTRIPDRSPAPSRAHLLQNGNERSALSSSGNAATEDLTSPSRVSRRKFIDRSA